MNDYLYDWTVMVYLSGDNNLSSEMLWALTEIERAAPDLLKGERKIAVTVQYDPLSPACGTLRYSLPDAPKKGTVKNRPVFPVPFEKALQEVLLRENAASHVTLRQFITWSIGNFPSEYRMLILSGHGSGAEGDFLTDNNPGPAANGPALHSGNGANAGVAAGLVNRDSPLLQPGTLTIPALGLVLKPPHEDAETNLAAGKAPLPLPEPLIHVLGMDSCLMSTLEVADQVSAGNVQFLVGSEGFIPNTGWPYCELLTRFRKQLDGDRFEPETMSAVIVDECADYYSEYLPSGVSLDIASCELAHIGSVRSEVATLATHLTKHIARRDIRNAVILAHWRAQAFKLEQYTDLWDFCSELATEVRDGGRVGKRIATACRCVLGAINRVVGIAPSKTLERPAGRGRQRSLGLDFQYARGLSIYFPWCAPTMAGVDYFAQYRRLSFPKKSGWGRFLDAYLRETMRPPRKTSRKALDDLPLLDVTGRGLMSQTKNVYEYNKNVFEYNKFIAQMFGGRPPGCARNPPQKADVSPQPRCAPTPRAARPASGPTPPKAARRPSAPSMGQVRVSTRVTNGSGRPWPSPPRPRVGGKRRTHVRKPTRSPMARTPRTRL
jgi:hypothetical protein